MTLLTTIQTIKARGFTPEITAKYSKEELNAILKILKEFEATGTSPTLDAIWGADFEERPVSIDEFVENDYYLGKIGKNLYPAWRQDLAEVCNPLSGKVEWILTGSIGSGKTYVALIALLYKVYYALCLKNPQRFFGLGDGSPIIFGLFNIFKYLVHATSYQYLITWLRDMSPYFKSLRIIDEKRRRKESDKQVLELPKGLGWAFGAQALHALGHNIFAGLLDEMEFGKQKSMTSTERSQIEDLYYNTRRRLDSRFLQGGGTNPGLLCLVSSARESEQFLAKHIGEHRDDPTTYVSSYALYEAKAHQFKDSDTFTVVVGDKLHRSYILDDEAEAQDPRPGAAIIEVPVEFLSAYRNNLDECIRDISGVTTYGKRLFLPRRDVLLKGIESSTPRVHPFSKEEVVLSLEDDVSIEDFFLKDEVIEVFDLSNNLYRPRFYPFADRFIHVDLAKNRDCAGLAMSCISETKSIKRYSSEGLLTNAKDYVFFIDMMLRIRAAAGSEIDFAKIRRFVFFLLYTCKFPIKGITYDSYQSTDSIQIFKKEHIVAKELSVDRKPGPYRTLRSVIMESRFDSYYYEPFVNEITLLEDHSGTTHKPLIDHPHDGSKDISDAVAGAVNGALIHKGVQITGTDADAIRERAEAYTKAMETSPSPRDGNWVKGDYKKRNPLEDLFN